jgi:hypothetical protein
MDLGASGSCIDGEDRISSRDPAGRLAAEEEHCEMSRNRRRFLGRSRMGQDQRIGECIQTRSRPQILLGWMGKVCLGQEFAGRHKVEVLEGCPRAGSLQKGRNIFLPLPKLS